MLARLFRRKAAEPVIDVEPYVSELTHIEWAGQQEKVDLDELATRLGLVIEYHPYRSEIAGTLQYFGGRWVIGVNRAHNETRQRFTIGHQIGHYILHRDLVAKRVGVAGVADTKLSRQPNIESLHNPHILIDHERQANWVAIKILLGSAKMRKYSAEGLSVFQIAERTGCSPNMTMARLKHLKLPINSGNALPV